MSHSTEISIEVGLDKFEIHCGSRLPATAFEIPADDHKSFKNDDGLRVLMALPCVGAGRRQLFEAIIDLARDEKQNGNPAWLDVQVEHFN